MKVISTVLDHADIGLFFIGAALVRAGHVESGSLFGAASVLASLHALLRQNEE